MTDPTRPNEPVDPTRAQPSSGGAGPSDPTRVQPAAGDPTGPGASSRRVEERTTTDPGAGPGRSGLSTGQVVAVTALAAVIALLVGFLVWGTDDDDEPVADETTTSVDDTAPTEDPAADELAAVTAERDTLQGQVDDLQSQLDDVTGERDDLRAQLDDAAAGEVELEDLEGRSIDDVRDLADENGWELIEQAPEDPDGVELGVVLAQSPEPGTTMNDGSVLVVETLPDAG